MDQQFTSGSVLGRTWINDNVKKEIGKYTFFFAIHPILKQEVTIILSLIFFFNFVSLPETQFSEYIFTFLPKTGVSRKQICILKKGYF